MPTEIREFQLADYYAAFGLWHKINAEERESLLVFSLPTG
jgi:hypothetical protein